MLLAVLSISSFKDLHSYSGIGYCKDPPRNPCIYGERDKGVRSRAKINLESENENVDKIEIEIL